MRMARDYFAQIAVFYGEIEAGAGKDDRLRRLADRQLQLKFLRP